MLDGGSRPLVFAVDGTSLYMGNAQFGNAPFWARFPGEENVSRFFDPSSRVSWLIDARNGAWRPDAYWGRPELAQGGNSTVGFFKYQGKVFGVMRYTTADAQKRSGFLVLRYDNYVGKIVAFYCPGKGGLVVVRDENQDGAITAADGEGTPVLDTAGKQVNAGEATVRFSTLEPGGDIRSQTFKRWLFKGLDAKGFPIYEIPLAPVFPIANTLLVSPYDFKTKVRPESQSESAISPDGELLAVLQAAGSPHGMGLSNSGGIDVARFRKDGNLRWYLPMNDYGPVQGVKQATPGFILTSWGHQAEWIGLDEDGLSLGHLGFPREAHWSGYWVDHPDQHVLFRGNDGRLHVLVGDYFLNGDHWLSLRNYDNYRKAVYPFSVTAARAGVLASRAPQTTFMQARSEKPRVTVKRLAQPLPIDGDLEKWRRIGLTPQIIITPATGSPNITSAKDCTRRHPPGL